MKAVKILLKVVVALVALVIIAVLALPLWFGPVGKTAANAIAPGLLKTDFHLGILSLNQYSGRFELGDMQLANPAGYSEKQAVMVGSIVFDCEPLSLMTDVIHIEEITVKDLFASVVTKDGVMNFTQIQYNLAGGKEKYEAAQAEAEAKAEAEKPAEEKEESEKPAKKIIIDKLEISGLKLQLGILPISLPSVTLTDIGRKSGGATFEEAWQQIVDGVLGAAGALGDQAKALLGSVGDVSKQATEAASKAAAQATEALGKVTGGATEAAGKATEAIGNVAGGAADAAGKAAESATKAVGDGAKAVGDGAKAVGDGAKKALDSLKSLG